MTLHSVCTQACSIYKDDENNLTGEPEPDGVEDADSPYNECAGGVADVVGDVWRCVNVRHPDEHPPYTICLPGTDFRPCVSTSDLPNATSIRITGHTTIRNWLRYQTQRSQRAQSAERL